MLAAAREVFAEHGVNAPLDLIARRAGVGRATQHRHFPTRESLVRAIFADNFVELEALVAEAEPEDAYLELLSAASEQLRENAAFHELLSKYVPGEIRQEVVARFLTLAEEPMRTAQAAGRIRTDLRLSDTLLLLDMMLGAAQPGPMREPDHTERALELILEAIRPGCKGL